MTLVAKNMGFSVGAWAIAGLVTMLSCGCSEGGANTAGSGGSESGGGGGGGGGGAGGAGAGTGGGTGGSTGTDGEGGASSRGPAYERGTAFCPADDGVRRIKLVNNCTETRWFKLDGLTTPTWARTNDCPWAGASCSDLNGVGQCSQIAASMTGGVNPGAVYCKATGAGAEGACACNPYFELEPGEEHIIELPGDAAFPSGTGWLAKGCNAYGAGCEIGNDAARNSTFEFTYDVPGRGTLWYDISAVNAWTSVSAIGMKSCGGGSEPDPNNVFWCRGTGCRFDVNTQCPDGTDRFAPAPSGCAECPTAIVNGKQVLAGSCGTCSDGSSANRIPTGTVFNANNVGGAEWTWTGSPDFAVGWGHDEGVHANRRYDCSEGSCTPAMAGQANTCLGGCDLCTMAQQTGAGDDACLKYCCPDTTRTYGGASYRYDSAGCTALGVQAGTDYSPAVKGECPYVYTFGYEDHSSTFQCTTNASMLLQACPDPADFPSSF